MGTQQSTADGTEPGSASSCTAALRSCKCRQEFVGTETAREFPDEPADARVAETKVQVDATTTHAQILQEEMNEAIKRVRIIEQAFLRQCVCSSP